MVLCTAESISKKTIFFSVIAHYSSNIITYSCILKTLITSAISLKFNIRRYQQKLSFVITIDLQPAFTTLYGYITSTAGFLYSSGNANFETQFTCLLAKWKWKSSGPIRLKKFFCRLKHIISLKWCIRRFYCYLNFFKFRYCQHLSFGGVVFENRIFNGNLWNKLSKKFLHDLFRLVFHN